MSAELLRRAADLIRERAKPIEDWYSAKAWATTTPFGAPIEPADAEYIASWHPAVALAVADWLTWVAGTTLIEGSNRHGYQQALAVARTYLGSTE